MAAFNDVVDYQIQMIKVAIAVFICLAFAEDIAVSTATSQHSPASELKQKPSSLQNAVTASRQQSTSSKSTAAQSSLSVSVPASSQGKQPPSNTKLVQNSPTTQLISQKQKQAMDLLSDLQIPTQLRLSEILPEGDSYDAIMLSLKAILMLFLIIQLLACACSKKKKKLTEKFEEYSQRAEIGELQEE